MALSSTRPLIEMRTRDNVWGGGGKGRRCVALALLLLCADFLKFRPASASWSPQDFICYILLENPRMSGLVMTFLSFCVTLWLITLLKLRTRPNLFFKIYRNIILPDRYTIQPRVTTFIMQKFCCYKNSLHVSVNKPIIR
jgi:hypothetical protein